MTVWFREIYTHRVQKRLQQSPLFSPVEVGGEDWYPTRCIGLIAESFVEGVNGASGDAFTISDVSLLLAVLQPP